MKIIQLTPQLLNENKYNSHIYLNNIILPTINSNSWMNQWQDIVSRFQLFKFLDLPTEDILAHSWNEEFIEQVVNETVQLVKQHIELDDNLQITVVPALPFPWFSNIDHRFGRMDLQIVVRAFGLLFLLIRTYHSYAIYLHMSYIMLPHKIPFIS